MRVKGSGVRAVGLPVGAVSTVARVCRKSRTYVWKVALGTKRGNPTIRRQLAQRGWKDPLAAIDPGVVTQAVA